MKKYIKTYGIACVDEQNGKREIVAEIHGVTTDREKAERIVDLFNRNNLSHEHLKDAVSDLISII